MSLLMVRKSAPAHAADKNENIAQDSEIVALWQVLGDAKAYLREGKKNHNVKNVLAASIKAAEKENPNDRSVLEAKKVLAQFDAAAGAAQDRGNYTENTEALLKMAYANLNKAASVVRVVLKNVADAEYKVKDGQTKSFLKDRGHEWWSCEREIEAVIKELSTIAVPPSYGVPHKEKIPPEERKIIAEFFGW